MRLVSLAVLAILGFHLSVASAQLPSAAEFHAAVAAARPLAQAIGLKLRTDALWSRALQSRVPMLATVIGGECHIGYNAYAPRIDADSLFPALPEADRRVWLGGVIHHEISHCADLQERASAGHAWAGGNDSTHSREVLADLAFALHVTTHSPRGRALVARLAELRAARAAEDPGHDTSGALHCYLAAPAAPAAPPPAAPPRAASDWLAVLHAWRARCQRVDFVAESAHETTR